MNLDYLTVVVWFSSRCFPFLLILLIFDMAGHVLLCNLGDREGGT